MNELIKITTDSIKWFAPDSEDGERSLRQHAFVHKVCKTAWIREEYNGNISLCKGGSLNDGEEKNTAFVDIEGEQFDESKACKKCLKIYNDLNKALKAINEI